MITSAHVEVPVLAPDHAVRNFATVLVAIGVIAGVVGWLGVFSLHVSVDASSATWLASGRTITVNAEIHNQSRLPIEVAGVGPTGSRLIDATQPAHVAVAGGATRAVRVVLHLADCATMRTAKTIRWRLQIRVRTPGHIVRTIEIGTLPPDSSALTSAWQYFLAQELCTS